MLPTQRYNPYIADGRVAVVRDSEKRILPAFILLLFLGAVGAHRFYIGRVASGLFLLFFNIVGIICAFSREDTIFGLGGLFLFSVGVWLIIDFIRIVVGSMTDGDDRTIKKWT